MSLSATRRHVADLAAQVRADRFRFFPQWARGSSLDTLRHRPLFLVGSGFGEGQFLDLDVRGWVDRPLDEFLVDGLVWHLGYPVTRRLGSVFGERWPEVVSAARNAGVGALKRMRNLRSRVTRLGVEGWIKAAKREPRALSLIVAQGPDARRYRRIARDEGFDALLVTEALRTPSFADRASGQFNDLLGDIPERIDEYLALESLFADEESVRVLHAVLAHRLTLDPDELDGVLHHPWREYFASGLFRWGEHERLLDVGAFTGDTLLRFMDATGGRFDRAICLEPDDRNHFFLQKLHATLKPNDADRVIVRKVGAWRETTRLSFQATGDMGARIGDDTSVSPTVTIDVTTIDALADELGAPTFVKCDAEGADRDVLAGGSRTFAKHRPRVAVSAYHLQDDLLALTSHLRASNPDYRLALRQYFPGHWDTVLYAL